MAETKARTAVGVSREERAVTGIRSWPARTKEFLRETRLEMKRVTWPEIKTVRATTVVVIVTTFFFAFYLRLADYVFGNLIHLLETKFRG